MNRALIFVNGEPPKQFPTTVKEYRYIVCTDGAYHNYLQTTSIKPHYIVGDLDSIDNKKVDNDIEIIHTPDQNKTDFEKTLLFLKEKGITQFDIYGASGHASDHFLGNLSVAKQYYQQLELNFYDNYCRFFFATSPTTIRQVKGKTISLYPFPKVEQLSITGFKYPLTDVTLTIGGLTSLRNEAADDLVSITFYSGDLLIFISHG